jgi:hypothetical protein
MTIAAASRAVSETAEEQQEEPLRDFDRSGSKNVWQVVDLNRIAYSLSRAASESNCAKLGASGVAASVGFALVSVALRPRAAGSIGTRPKRLTALWKQPPVERAEEDPFLVDAA